VLKTPVYGFSRYCERTIQHTNQPTAEKTLEQITPRRLSSFSLINRFGFLIYPEDVLYQESDELVRYVTNLEEVNQELVLNRLKRIATLEEINSQLATGHGTGLPAVRFSESPVVCGSFRHRLFRGLGLEPGQ